jgi:hypothetical protein
MRLLWARLRAAPVLAVLGDQCARDEVEQVS